MSVRAQRLNQIIATRVKNSKTITPVTIKPPIVREPVTIKWVDCGDFWVIRGQRHPGWLEGKRGRVGGSGAGYGVGHGKHFKTPEKYARELAGIEDAYFTEEAKRKMALGVKWEPMGVSYYCKKNGCVMTEAGFVVPKWDLEIGVSVDGIPIWNSDSIQGFDLAEADIHPEWWGDGIIEIKAPEEMYLPLEEYMEQQQKGLIVKTPTRAEDFDHIWTTHYDQMQWGMGILKRVWCDYEVISPPTKKVFIQRVPFDPDYWETTLYSGVRKFIDVQLRPLLPLEQLAMPPCDS